MAKIRIFWFSKTGKILFKIIIWIIIWIFAIIWIITSRIIHIQYKNWWYEFTDLRSMQQWVLNKLWYSLNWMSNDQKFTIMWHGIFKISKDETRYINELKDKSITIDDTFTWTNTTGFDIILKFPNDSKYMYYYWESIENTEDKNTIWRKFHEIKIEISGTKQIYWSVYLSNSKYKYFWEKSDTINIPFDRHNNQIEPLEEWEKACIILTSLNPITSTIRNLHDKNCEFWNINSQAWYDELLVRIGMQRYFPDENTVIPEIKITPITIDMYDYNYTQKINNI